MQIRTLPESRRNTRQLLLACVLAFTLVMATQISVRAYDFVGGLKRSSPTIGFSGNDILVIGNGVDTSLNIGRTAIVSTGSPTGVASVGGVYQATLHGTVTSLGVSSNVSAYFQWGYDLSYGNTSPLTQVSNVGAYSATITGFMGDHIVHYRSVVNMGGLFYYGSDKTIPLTPIQQGNSLVGMLIAIAIALVVTFLLFKLAEDEGDAFSIVRAMLIAGVGGTVTYYVVMVILRLVNG